VKSKPNRIPERSATGGERIPVSERTRARTKSIFARACMERRKSIRGKGARARASATDEEISLDCASGVHNPNARKSQTLRSG
jgi:hypothetical protein